MKECFPALQKGIAFLDSAASAQKPQAVIDAITHAYRDHYANIHRGLYAYSQKTTADFEAVRGKVANFLNAKENEIVFTRNSTEGVNLVAASWGGAHLKAGDEIILTQMEHHANIVPWHLLHDKIGVIIKYIPVTAEGTLDLSALDSLLTDRTKLLSFVHISNALGTINPAEEIVMHVRAFNPAIKILIDGSQSAVHMKVDVRDLGCDWFVFTGHKLYGPTGVGVLWGKYEVLAGMPPYQGGGDMIERVSLEGTTYREPPFRFEAGTPAIAEVIGLGAAISFVESIGWDIIAAHEKKLMRCMEESLRGIEGLELLGRTKRAGIYSFTTEWAAPADIGMILDQCGVAVRTGHHCCQPLMDAFGIAGTTRASLALYNDENDIHALGMALEKARKLLT